MLVVLIRLMMPILLMLQVVMPLVAVLVMAVLMVWPVVLTVPMSDPACSANRALAPPSLGPLRAELAHARLVENHAPHRIVLV